MIRRNFDRRPVTLNEWQGMFRAIYPRSAEDRGRSTIGLFEEIGELAEAIRVFERHPEYFAGEAADVFSYLMGIANEVAIRLEQEEDKLFSLEDEFLKRYPGLCPQCGSQICICPSVPEATVGRLAKELEIDVLENLFNLPPREFATDGQKIAAEALEAAGGYRGLAQSFPFDRGDANRALVMLCLRLGDVLRPSNPDLAERFHSAALRVGGVVSEPGARAKSLEVAELLNSIKTVWRDLEPSVKRQLESGTSDLAIEVGASFSKVRVLFVACSPSSEARVRGDRELRAIRQSINAMRREGDIEIRDLTAATPDDLRRALLQEDFDIIHFSGHSNSRVLCFEDERGEAQEISLDSLATYVGTNLSVRCVVLNSCESLSALTVTMADYTVGMDENIEDDAAIKFATGFYDAVGAGKEIEAAVEEGRNAAELVGLSVPVRVLTRKH
jgi:NTP pyrophosphatase (non-canonical NTP hydrolase)